MANKQEALQEIITIAENHRLSVDEVVAAMRTNRPSLFNNHTVFFHACLATLAVFWSLQESVS